MVICDHCLLRSGNLHRILVITIMISVFSGAISLAGAHNQYSSPPLLPLLSLQAQISTFTQQSVTFGLSISATRFQSGPPPIEIGTLNVSTFPQVCGLVCVTGYGEATIPITLPNWQQLGADYWATSSQIVQGVVQNLQPNSWPYDNYTFLVYLATNTSNIEFNPAVQVAINHYTADVGIFNNSVVNSIIAFHAPNYTDITVYRLSVHMIVSDREVVSFLSSLPFDLSFIIGAVIVFTVAFTSYPLLFNMSPWLNLNVPKIGQYMLSASIQIGLGILLFIPFFLLAFSGFAPPLPSEAYYNAVVQTSVIFFQSLILLVYSVAFPYFKLIMLGIRRKRRNFVGA